MVLLLIKLEYRIQVMGNAVVCHSLTGAQPVPEQKVKSQIIISLLKS